MTKQELLQAAKEIREICCDNGIYCADCDFSYAERGRYLCPIDGGPANWDIERLERGEDG